MAEHRFIVRKLLPCRIAPSSIPSFDIRNDTPVVNTAKDASGRSLINTDRTRSSSTYLRLFPLHSPSSSMKPKLKANNIFTTILSTFLTIAFFWFFIFAPSEPQNSASLHRPFQPSRRNSQGIIMRFDLRNITSTSHALQNKEKVLILTPIARWYDEYWSNLMKLSYPRELIDLGFIIPKGTEGDQILENLKVRLKGVQGKSSLGGKFNHVTILRQDVEVPISQDEKGSPGGS